MDGNGFLKEPKIKIEFSEISFKIGNNKILDSISGNAKEGKVVALMGPSGCGKTSLLNILSFRTQFSGVDDSEIKGTLLYDGKRMNKSNRSNIGYVMQNDIFFETFTIKETMMFYAHMLLPETMSINQKKNKINEIIDILELKDSFKTIVGGNFNRGLSGGEKKRLNIAVELLTDPEVLVLDEPTSGLDSRMSMHVVRILKKLAVEKNKTIIASIHQPSSQIFHMFDDLLLMSHGKVAYFGKINGVEEFFELAGFPCPIDWNIADHIINTIYANVEDRSFIIEFHKKTCDFAISKTAVTEQSDSVLKRSKCGYLTQIKFLSFRSFKYGLNSTLLSFSFLQNMITSIFVGLIFFQTGFYISNLYNSFGLVFYTSLSYFVQPLFSRLMTFEPEFTVVKKERMSGMYRLSAYYIGKITIDILLISANNLLIWPIVYFLAGLTASWHFFLSLIIILIFSFLSHSFSLFICSFGMPYGNNIGICTFLVYFWILFGGFYNTNFPSGLSFAKYLSPIYYSYVSQIYIQMIANDGVPCYFGTNDTIQSGPIELCNNASTSAPIQSILDILSMNSNPLIYLILHLTVMIIFYLGGFFNLKRSISPKKKKFSIHSWILSKIKSKQRDQKSYASLTSLR